MNVRDRYDVETGQSEFASLLRGTQEKVLKRVWNLTVPTATDHNAGLFAVASENGNVLLCDSKTNHLVRRFKMNAASRQLAFHPTRSLLYSCDREGHIYEWDLGGAGGGAGGGVGTRGPEENRVGCGGGSLAASGCGGGRCVRRFRNENCVELFALASGVNRRTGRALLAAGTSSGTVDVFDISGSGSGDGDDASTTDLLMQEGRKTFDGNFFSIFGKR